MTHSSWPIGPGVLWDGNLELRLFAFTPHAVHRVPADHTPDTSAIASMMRIAATGTLPGRLSCCDPWPAGSDSPRSGSRVTLGTSRRAALSKLQAPCLSRPWKFRKIPIFRAADIRASAATGWISKPLIRPACPIVHWAVDGEHGAKSTASGAHLVWRETVVPLSVHSLHH